MMYVKADDESILPYGEEVQRRQSAFLPLDLSTVVLGVGIIYEFVILGDGVLYDYNGIVEDVVIPETVNRIGNDAFAYHSEINEITLPESIVEICDGAFYSCTSFYRYEDTCIAEFAKENGYYFEIVESETAKNEEEIAE